VLPLQMLFHLNANSSLPIGVAQAVKKSDYD